MTDIDYQAAYERQKKAREQAENLLENRSRELYESKQALETACKNLKNEKLKLLHQEKLASIGQLSAGIAHEINNPASFVKSNLQMLKTYMEQLTDLLAIYQKNLTTVPDNITELEEEYDLEYMLEDLPTLINDSLDGTYRITDIVNGLRNFSRVDSDAKESLNVNECIENTLKLVNNEVKYKANLSTDLCADLPLTMGYPGGLSQVILNLLVNASHAMEEFGEISAKTHVERNHIIIRVEDNGSGMTEDVMEKIFDPFYTTKGEGVGTGLGLSISQGIIEQHEGELSVVSEVGKGTCFTISLPVVEVGSC